MTRETRCPVCGTVTSRDGRGTAAGYTYGACNECVKRLIRKAVKGETR